MKTLFTATVPFLQKKKKKENEESFGSQKYDHEEECITEKNWSDDWQISAAT